MPKLKPELRSKPEVEEIAQRLIENVSSAISVSDKEIEMAPPLMSTENYTLEEMLDLPAGALDDEPVKPAVDLAWQHTADGRLTIACTSDLVRIGWKHSEATEVAKRTVELLNEATANDELLEYEDAKGIAVDEHFHNGVKWDYTVLVPVEKEGKPDLFAPKVDHADVLQVEVLPPIHTAEWKIVSAEDGSITPERGDDVTCNAWDPSLILNSDTVTKELVQILHNFERDTTRLRKLLHLEVKKGTRTRKKGND